MSGPKEEKQRKIILTEIKTVMQMFLSNTGHLGLPV